MFLNLIAFLKSHGFQYGFLKVLTIENLSNGFYLTYLFTAQMINHWNPCRTATQGNHLLGMYKGVVQRSAKFSQI